MAKDLKMKMDIYVATPKSKKSLQKVHVSQNLPQRGGVCQIFLFFEGTPPPAWQLLNLNRESETHFK